MFGTIWVCEFTFSTLNFMNSKYRSNIAKENFASELKCVLSVKDALDFEDQMQEKNVKYLVNVLVWVTFRYDNILDILG